MDQEQAKSPASAVELLVAQTGMYLPRISQVHP